MHLKHSKRECATKEAMPQGRLNSDEDSLMQFKQTISPIKQEVITVYNSDDENSIFNIKKKTKEKA